MLDDAQFWVAVGVVPLAIGLALLVAIPLSRGAASAVASRGGIR